MESGRKLFFGLFVFPSLIAVGMAVLLCCIVLLTHEVETPESLINDIKTGSPSKRWQKAFELSNELNREQSVLREESLLSEIVYILQDRDEYDSKTRSYMALALSRFQSDRARQALRDLLKAETSPSVQIYLMWALGYSDAREAVEDIAGFLRHENPDLRKVSAYVVGVLGNQKHIQALAPLLKDGTQDIRWNAALSLAKLGSDEGEEILFQMIDRQSLEASHLSESKVEEVMTSGLKGLGLLRLEKSIEIIQRIAASEESLKVRQAAMDVLKVFKA